MEKVAGRHGVAGFQARRINRTRGFRNRRGPYAVLGTLLLSASAALPACSYVGTAISGIAQTAGLFRLPIVIPTGPPNHPATPKEIAGLQALSDKVLRSNDRYDGLDVAQAGLSESLGDAEYDVERQGLRYPGDAFDDLRDLRDPRRQALTFAAFSGGGTRAAVLAAQTMALLEQTYNEVVAQTDWSAPVPFTQSVDAYSSVSGGSIYAYHVAYDTILRKAETAYLSQALQPYLSGRGYDPELIRLLMGFEPPVPAHCLSLEERRALQVTEGAVSVEGIRGSERFAECTIAHRDARRMTVPGLQSGLMYLSPINFFYGPLTTLFTDNSYLEFLAHALHFSKAGSASAEMLCIPRIGIVGPPPLFKPEGLRCLFGRLDPQQVTLGMIGDRPRFFFNTTSLETGGPFVLTQRMMHLPSDEVPLASARLDLEPRDDPRFRRPLGRALTLEEIGSSPSRFPLASAAYASAAFPIGNDPMPVQRFGYSATMPKPYPTTQYFHLADGGVWDNSGLLALTDLYRHIAVNQPVPPPPIMARPPRLILISVNAETEAYALQPIRDPAEEAGVLHTLKRATPLLPLRLESIYPSIGLIHYTNKRRAEQMAIDLIKRLVNPPQPCLGDVCPPRPAQRAFYFPINLTQLSQADPQHIPGHEKLFARVQAITTNYTMDSSDHTKLAEAAEILVSTPQGKCKGWFVGPQCLGKNAMTEVQRLDEAVALAMIRTQAELWPDDGGPDPLMQRPEFHRIAQEWCRREPVVAAECGEGTPVGAAQRSAVYGPDDRGELLFEYP